MGHGIWLDFLCWLVIIAIFLYNRSPLWLADLRGVLLGAALALPLDWVWWLCTALPLAFHIIHRDYHRVRPLFHYLIFFVYPLAGFIAQIDGAALGLDLLALAVAKVCWVLCDFYKQPSFLYFYRPTLVTHNVTPLLVALCVHSVYHNALLNGGGGWAVAVLLAMVLGYRNVIMHQAILAFSSAVMNALEVRDRGTRHHSERVRDIAVDIGKAMNLPVDELNALALGARLHDIGKLVVPDTYLKKPDHLDIKERVHMQRHVQYGVQLLTPLASWLDQAYDAICFHHEHWDGSGYPYGIKRQDIPLLARIIAVADAYEAMTANRPYRQALSPQMAAEAIAKGAGVQFDPDVVRVFLALWNRKPVWYTAHSRDRAG